MDTSEKYILMCEKAQKDINKEPEWGDLVWDEEAGDITLTTRINPKKKNKWHKDEIPLYRQDQLQEMVLSAPAKHNPRKYWNSIGIELKGVLEIDSCISWEQLWLAFVMHEKYQKRWDEKKGEWII